MEIKMGSKDETFTYDETIASESSPLLLHSISEDVQSDRSMNENGTSNPQIIEEGSVLSNLKSNFEHYDNFEKNECRFEHYDNFEKSECRLYQEKEKLCFFGEYISNFGTTISA